MSDASTIATRRNRALMLVRIAALILAILGGIPLCYSLALTVVMHDISTLAMMRSDTNWTAWGLAFLIPAGILIFFDRRIVRWLIPVPRRECHECGYPLRGLSPASARCPECGTAITPSGIDSIPARK